MTTADEWRSRVGQSWADSYAATDRAFSGLTRHLLTRLAALPGRSVLDIGCGAGELALAIASSRSDAEVVGLDISSDLIAAACRRMTQQGSNTATVRFITGDAANWNDGTLSLSAPGDCPAKPFIPDLLVSRHGVMFFDDPVAAFTNLHTIAAPGANLIFSCFRTIQDNHWASGLARLLGLPPAVDPFAPGPFAFAEPDHVRPILAATGWRDIAFEAVDFDFLVGAGEDALAQARLFFARIGVAARVLRELDGDALTDAERRISDWLGQQCANDIIALPAAAWVVSAMRN